jgi:hypothetical protein
MSFASLCCRGEWARVAALRRCSHPSQQAHTPHGRSGIFESSIGSGVPSGIWGTLAAEGKGTASGRTAVTRRLTPGGSWSLISSMCPSCSSGMCLIVISRLYVVNCAQHHNAVAASGGRQW